MKIYLLFVVCVIADLADQVSDASMVDKVSQIKNEQKLVSQEEV